ncbi:MAG: hypothetical protein B6244_14035 [Candidatus Cloacimonetes bacterium 4572_55]|nr:MAG: hypothetical protein B6244_14035 [Candidatus Cloacimonetes bacterium 4572_55]
MFKNTWFCLAICFVFLTAIFVGCSDDDDADDKKIAEVLVQGSAINGANGVIFDSQDQLHIASVIGRSITVMDRETGEIIDVLGTDTGVDCPDDLIFAPDGTLYWTSFLTGEVGRLDTDGTVKKQFVGPGVNPITISDDGRLFAALDFLGDGLYELDPNLEEAPRLIIQQLGFLNAFDFGPDGLLYGPIWTQKHVVRIDVDAEQPTVEVVADGFELCSAVKFNSQGELHVADQKAGSVYRVDVNTGEKTLVGSGLHKTDNLAFDSSDRLFVSSADDGYIGEVLSDGTGKTVYAGGMVFFGGITYQSNSLFVADLFNLREVDPQTGEELSVATSYLGVPGITTSMTVASDGENMIVTSWFARAVQVWNHSDTQVVEQYFDFGIPLNAIRFQEDLIVVDLITTSLIRADGQNPEVRTTIADLTLPVGMAADEHNLWVSDWGTGEIFQVIQADSVLTDPLVLASNLLNPEGMTLGSDGELFVVEVGADRVVSIDLESGAITPVVEELDLGSEAVPGMPSSWIFNDITLSPDGTLYVTGDRGKVLYKIK